MVGVASKCRRCRTTVGAGHVGAVAAVDHRHCLIESTHARYRRSRRKGSAAVGVGSRLEGHDRRGARFINVQISCRRTGRKVSLRRIAHAQTVIPDIRTCQCRNVGAGEYRRSAGQKPRNRCTAINRQRYIPRGIPTADETVTVTLALAP